MAKTSRTTLIETVAEELVIYLGSGHLNQRALTRALDFSGLEISNFDRLKELHFVLSDAVIEYIDALPERLRRLKTINHQKRTTVRGEVRGRIEWEATKQRRYREGYNDPSVFVTSTPAVEYDIPENRVVKKLLAAIARPLARDIEGVDQTWRAAWDDTDIVQLQQTLARNVYLSRLPAPTEISLSPRDLDRARRSRQPLYTEAQQLYQLYDDLLNNRVDTPAVQELLTETLVVPQETHQLFELYCVFGILRRLREHYPDLQLERIATGTDAIATLTGNDHRLAVYYDEAGPLSFFETYPRAAELTDPAVPEMVRRHAQALEYHEAALSEFIDRDTDRRFYSGRPDVLVLKYDTTGTNEQLTDVLIGEVKHTTAPETFATGLRELSEYLYFARTNTEYLFDTSASSVSVTGLICTDGVTTAADSSHDITHLTADDF